MIGRLNHVAIAVPDLAAAAAQYETALGAKVGAPQDEPDHGVTVIFIELPNTKIELLYPLGEDSPINGFLEKNPAGGIHHVCYEVDDIIAARDHLKETGARVLGSGEPKIGAHGKPVLFYIRRISMAASWSWSRSDGHYFRSCSVCRDLVDDVLCGVAHSCNHAG